MEMPCPDNTPGIGSEGGGWRRVSTRKWARNQVVVCLFVLAWLIFLHFRLALHPVPGVQVLGQAFDLTREASFPTFWGCLLSLGVGLCCFAIAHFLPHGDASPSRRRSWGFAGLVMLVFAVDDAIAFHERVGSITSLKFVDAMGYTSYPWHLTVGPILGLGFLVAGLVIWRDIRKLRGLTTALFLAVAGHAAAFALDIREGTIQMASLALQQPAKGSESLPMAMAVEESLEIAGTTLLLFVVFRYLTHLIGDLDLRWKESGAEHPRTPPLSAITVESRT